MYKCPKCKKEIDEFQFSIKVEEVGSVAIEDDQAVHNYSGYSDDTPQDFGSYNYQCPSCWEDITSYADKVIPEDRI